MISVATGVTVDILEGDPGAARGSDETGVGKVVAMCGIGDVIS